MIKKFRSEIMVPAPLWKRIIAYLIDILIILLIIILPLYPSIEAASLKNIKNINDPIILTATGSTGFSKNMIIASLSIIILTILYFAILEYKIQQTIGKLLLSIKVVSQQRQKQKSQNPTFSQCILRNITKFSSLLLLLDTVYMFTKKQNHRFFEVLSKTEVIEAKNHNNNNNEMKSN